MEEVAAEVKFHCALSAQNVANMIIQDLEEEAKKRIIDIENYQTELLAFIPEQILNMPLNDLLESGFDLKALLERGKENREFIIFKPNPKKGYTPYFRQEQPKGNKFDEERSISLISASSHNKMNQPGKFRWKTPTKGGKKDSAKKHQLSSGKKLFSRGNSGFKTNPITSGKKMYWRF